jgi:polysaccharide deacetylase family protein (PEP-CTERM system associated)
MNIITFDTEEWYTEYKGLQRPEEYALFDEKLDQILESLERNKVKGTFFCVGQLAVHFPEVVKKIQNKGHEIGCHSNVHNWLNKMSYEECLTDTRNAVDAIEQCIGEKVLSYRAPAFSIGKKNQWAFDIFAECGIERDSSVFPAARDFGGFPDFGQQRPCVIRHNGISIKEFPIPMTTVLGKKVAYSGGGYFRFFPLGFVEKTMAKTEYSMTYFHIRDLIAESKSVMTKERYEAVFKEKGTLKARYKRYFKSSVGKKKAMSKLLKLIDEMEFVNLTEADNNTAWDKAPVVELLG